MSDIPANAATTATLGFDRAVSGRLDYSGDRDWFRIDVAAGDWVKVTQRAAGSDPLEDSMIRVYDADGRLITADDELNTSTSNTDGAVTFGGGAGGTYFIEAASYRNYYSGDYKLSADLVNAPSGNPVEALDSGTQRSDSNITVHFVTGGQRAKFGYLTGDTQDDIRSEGWSSYEKSRFMSALDTITAVTNLTFTQTTDKNADFQVVLDTNELNNSGLLGYFYLPSGTRASVGVFNGNGLGWDDYAGGGLEAGGLGFSTIVHEVLHGLGLTHPHDSDAAIPGVDTPFRDLGANGLNQGIFTAMTYNSGYADQPTYSNRSGYESGPMALDIAALQDLYGANTSTATGNNTYVLPDLGDTYRWQAIWDAGGNDTMRYDGARDSIIDLRAASLTYDIGGGGFVSHAGGITGGFTIANGVTIENAVGGIGDDRLIGNSAANTLSGGAGDDDLRGGAGNDTLNGGADNDRLSGGTGRDTIDAGSGNDVASGGAQDDLIIGGAGNDQLTGNSGDDVISAASGANTILGRGGADRLTGGTGQDRIEGGSGADVIDGQGADDTVIGGRGDDTIDGGDGDDVIKGGMGADLLIGGLGADRFVFDFVTDSAPNSALRDAISDFAQGQDKIDLSAIDADRSAVGDQLFVFVGTDAFDAAGQLRLDEQAGDTIVQLDRDGDGFADMEVLITGITGLTSEDFIL
ncbi:M10 family metallopeptidase [Yoonia sediminilitoris]|uniref:Serralysin n=1 Tax=Yoonia sediminilitoris TaxID=1286148 RepID=A0A2T6KH85_9RHOB|nr:M10 family metallopeptidase [Yoonia sediminilitoris]PUB14845.1 serralysin [Yoonia sediminilitoris]RCW95562.1 serralysin [Yoonia sediminilitoris]